MLVTAIGQDGGSSAGAVLTVNPFSTSPAVFNDAHLPGGGVATVSGSSASTSAEDTVPNAAVGNTTGLPPFMSSGPPVVQDTILAIGTPLPADSVLTISSALWPWGGMVDTRL